MVYLEPHQLGWRPLCLSWLNTFPETIKQTFKDRVLALFDWLVPVSIRFMKREIKEAAETTYEGTNVAVNLMRTFKSLLVEQLADPKGLIASIKREADMQKHIDSCFVFSLAWSIGGTANSNEGRLAFDEFVRVAYKGELDLPHGDNTVYQGPSGEKYNLPEDIPEGHMTTQTPPPPDEVKTKDLEGNLVSTRTTIYDFRWDVSKSEWVPWENDIDKSPIPPEMGFKQIIVPTVDTVR
jgi:dynein heavy chain